MYHTMCMQWHIQGFFGHKGTHIEPTKWHWGKKFSKFVPPDTLKIHSLTLSVLRFLCKTFPKLRKLTLRKTIFRCIRGLIFGRKNTSIWNLLNFLFFLFFQYKARISPFFTTCKMWNMFKVNTKDSRIRAFNDKVKNKNTIDVVLASLLLTLNTFHFLLQCFFCWLWSVNCRLGLLFVVLTLFACWNQFRQRKN